MFQVDEKPETIHLYVVREEEPRPSVLPIVASFLLLLCVIAVGTLFPYRQPLERKTISVPAIFLPLKTFITTVPINPTGIKSYPATSAHGELTIYNGSVIEQRIPAGMILSSSNGVEVVVEDAVVVPAGNPPNYGIATVGAYAKNTGKSGNIQQNTLNQVIGSSLYIRNTHSFTGGKDAYSVSFVTPTDRATALEVARTRLKAQISAGILAEPCKEVVNSQVSVVGLVVKWTCQFVAYPKLPGMKVTHIRLVGKNLFVDVLFVACPMRIWAK